MPFTYQGDLSDSGTPVNGVMDLQISLWNAQDNGIRISRILSVNNVEVLEGGFIVKLDFGRGGDSVPFNGDPCWLEIALRPSGSKRSFTTLTDRQDMTIVPSALKGKGSSRWTGSGADIRYHAVGVEVGISQPLHIVKNSVGHWLGLKELGGAQWNFDQVSNPAIGYHSALRVASDSSRLALLLPDEPGGMRMYLWTKGRAVPNMPHTGIKPTFAVHGDMLIGDIITICRNPMTMFMRVESNISAASPTIFFSSKKGISSDVDGGAGILLHPDHHQDLSVWPNDPVDHPESGSLQLIAYGRGSGRYANAIRLQTRSEPGQVTDRMIIKDGTVTVLGNIVATGAVTPGSSRQYKGNIVRLKEAQAADLLSRIDPVSFVYRTDPQTTRMGFIAEEVPDAFAAANRNSVDTLGVAAMLTRVVKQQQNQIEQLQGRVIKLENMIERFSRQQNSVNP